MPDLEAWERTLRPRMTSIDLIGELDLAPEEAQEIGSLIAGLIRRSTPQEATRRLERRYPSAFAAYLVFQGGNSYDRGDFWGGVCVGAGLPNEGNFTTAWGQAFERTCRRFGLTRAFAGHRYVGAILGHGGIPAISLPDFFEHMLQPSISKPELAVLSVPDLIDDWLSGSAQYAVDKPIVRFLEYGGKVAEDFVARCQRMAWEYANEGEVPPAPELGLPGYLVNAYRTWVDRTSHMLAIARTGLRLKKPGIALDPWGRGPHVVLPEEQVPSTQSLASMWWEVDADGSIDSVQVDARRVDMDLKTRAACAVIRKAASEYRVRLYRQLEPGRPELLREWIYAGIGPNHPFLVFDPDSGTLIQQPKRLPARVMWILCPPNSQLKSDPAGASTIEEKFPQLPWEWQTWKGFQINLQGVDTFKLLLGSTSHSLPVSEIQEHPTAELISAFRMDGLEDAVPLFIGAPPTLRIHTGDRDSTEGHLARWRFELTHEWNADPDCSAKLNFSDCADLIQRKDGLLELPLADSRFLGASPVGQYRIRLQGPLGRSADLRFRVTPRLLLVGHENLYLPTAGKGAPEVQLRVTTDARSHIEPLETDGGLVVERLASDAQTQLFRVTVAPERVDAPLRLVCRTPSGQLVFLPLRIPIQRLRWTLILSPDQLARPIWQSSPSSLNLAQLEQSESPFLMLELPAADNRLITAQLCFFDLAGHVIAELQTPQPRGPGHLRRFDLRSVRDALRESQSPAIRVEMQIGGLPEHGPQALTVLTLKRRIMIERTTAALRQIHGEQHLEITWTPEIPLRWRHIRLWSQTRPWVEPLSFAVPDAVHHRASFAVAADTIPPGRYLVEFVVFDPWLPVSTTDRPHPDATNVASVDIGSLEERLAQLSLTSYTNHEEFACACERAFLWQALGQPDQVSASLQECWTHLNIASLPQMLAMAREFEAIPTGKAISIKLYHTDQIRQVISAHRDGTLSDSLLASYFARLPPLTRLAPQAGEVLLKAPDPRHHLAAARHLIEHGNPAGIRVALEWERSGQLSRQGLDELMSINIPLAADYIGSQLPPEECTRLLKTSENPDFQLAMARSLMRDNHPDGVTIVVRLRERRMISSAQAVGTLSQNLAFAARILAEKPEDKATANVLTELLDVHPSAIPIIRPGAWVHCSLGWAKIDQIVASDGKSIAALAPNNVEPGLRLQVTFNPGPNPIKATIDTSRQLIAWQGLSTVYQCAKCNQYIAVRVNLVVSEHNRMAHGGIGPSYRPLPSPVRISGRLEFRHKPPT